jgi:hypothetical protein
MRSPSKGRKPAMTLADLAPQQQITCFWCRKPKPAAGAKPFRAHHVCADCVPLVGASKPAKTTKP